MEQISKIEIGTKFIRRNSRNNVIEEVTDIHTTFNSAGKVVRRVFVAKHEFMGQDIFDYEVPESTITLGKNLTNNS